MRKADYNYLDSVYNTAFAKIFTSCNKNIIRNCQFYCVLLPFNLRIDIRRLKFYAKFSSIKNYSVRGLYVLGGKHEHDNLLKKHSLSLTDSVGACVHRIWQNFSGSMQTLN